MQVKYDFEASVWRYNALSSWCFVSIPAYMAQEIREFFGREEAGFGRLPVNASIGVTTWKTAIWFDTKHKTYLLPVKSSVRKQEGIAEHALVRVSIFI
ncbi:MAG: DUF1905 domain-containing protein [Fluviicola sp.]|jgi:hypothetical protein